MLISPLVKIGVSIPELKAGVVADYIADPEFFQQIIGRFIRKKTSGSNTAEIMVFNDVQHPSYAAGCSKLFSKIKTIQGFNVVDLVVL